MCWFFFSVFVLNSFAQNGRKSSFFFFFLCAQTLLSISPAGGSCHNLELATHDQVSWAPRAGGGARDERRCGRRDFTDRRLWVHRVHHAVDLCAQNSRPAANPGRKRFMQPCCYFSGSHTHRFLGGITDLCKWDTFVFLGKCDNMDGSDTYSGSLYFQLMRCRCPSVTSEPLSFISALPHVSADEWGNFFYYY